jgi:hypothetical protein
MYRCSLSQEIGYGSSKSLDRCVFFKVVIVSGACQICKSILQIINSIVQTQLRILKKVACKYIINKVILDVKLLLFIGSELLYIMSCVYLRLILHIGL